MENEIISVGIDIGTTTTQLIFSKITIQNTSNPFIIPDIKITNKEIIYRSEVYFTPIRSNQLINLPELKKIIVNEYEKANIRKDQITTGAIIITGESSRKENAEIVLSILSDFAGDFVVATAGADLEGILAGHGAGASEISKDKATSVVNFDIGGGTTNVVIFDNGNVVDAFALDIGGRLIKFNENKEIVYISDRIKYLIKFLNIDISINKVPRLEELKKLTDYFAEILFDINSSKNLEEIKTKLFIGHKHKAIESNNIMFSGGVAEFVYNNSNYTDLDKIIEFGDMGPLLGYSIKELFGKNKNLLEPKEKIRATVIGTGTYSTKISGSTIFYDEKILPIKNIPIVRISFNSEKISDIYLQIEEKLSIYNYNPIAIYLEGIVTPSYEQLKSIGKFIVAAFVDKSLPIIVIVENDFAKALGQTISNIMKTNFNIISIDKISVDEGNYIDIGSPIAGVLPVIVKTLIFKS